MQSQLLYFDDERAAALRLAEASGLAAAAGTATPATNAASNSKRRSEAIIFMGKA